MSETEPKQHTVGILWPILATLVVLVVGVASIVLWLPAAFILFEPGSDPAARALAIYGSAGPFACLLALIVGWVRVRQGSRSGGLKWMIVLPAIWLVGLFGWLTFLSTVCEGQWSCGV